MAIRFKRVQRLFDPTGQKSGNGVCPDLRIRLLNELPDKQRGRKESVSGDFLSI